MTGYMSSCPDCGKRLYASKQAAKRIARVVAGRVTRREVYQ